MGYNTCLLAMDKRKLKLLVLASDVSENTMKKLVKAATERNVVYRIYGTCDDLSQACGTMGRGVFGITDRNFANVILKEIDESQSM